jgi:hypothetical protein
VLAIPMQQTIKNAIFTDYEKSNRPVNNVSAAVTVRLNPALFSINEVVSGVCGRKLCTQNAFKIEKTVKYDCH